MEGNTAANLAIGFTGISIFLWVVATSYCVLGDVELVVLGEHIVKWAFISTAITGILWILSSTYGKRG